MTARSKPRVIICADSGFYGLLKLLERNILRYWGEYPVIYDLGLTDQQRRSLSAPLHKIEPPEDFREKSESGNIKASHKARCVAHFLQTYDRPCLYLDADIVQTGPVRRPNIETADIAVTPRHPKEISQLPDPFKNGRINSGVIYFACTHSTMALVHEWDNLCMKSNISDQRALSDLLYVDGKTLGREGLKISEWPAVIYNDTSCLTGRFWHFKNAGRRGSKRLKWWVTMQAALMFSLPLNYFIVRQRKKARWWNLPYSEMNLDE